MVSLWGIFGFQDFELLVFLFVGCFEVWGNLVRIVKDFCYEK